MTSSQKKFSSAWLIVAACLLIQAIPFGIPTNTQSQFVSYVIEENGFTLAGFSLIFTLGTVASAIASPFIAGLFKKINTKIMYTIGCVLAGGGFFLYSLCTQLWQFYAVAAVVNIGTAIISSIGVPILINSWFDEASRGKALGIAFAGSGLGNIFLQQLVVSSLATYGASRTYMSFGLIAIAIGVPISLLLIRQPKNDSEVVKGSKKREDEISPNTNNFGYTLQEATKLKLFWVYAIGLFFLGMYVSALAMQFPAYLRNGVGLSPAVVGTVGSVFALFCLGGNLGGGVIFDKVGVVKGLIVAFVLAGTASLSLVFAKQIPQLAFVFAVTKGLSVFAYMLGPSILTGAFFGQKDFGSILGIAQMVFAVGFAAGSSVFGLFVDKFGYTVAWSSEFVFVVICYSALISTAIGMTKLNRIKEKSLNDKIDKAS